MKKLITLLPLLFVLVSCGGGGGSSSGSGSTSVSVDRTSINVVAHNTNSTIESVGVTINNVPEAGLYTGVAVERENYSITSANFYQVGNNSAVIDLQFAAGSFLSAGTHTNQVALVLCYDVECNRHIQGSPLLIDTTLEVEEIPEVNVEISIPQNSISVSGNSAEEVTPDPETLTINVAGYEVSELYVRETEVSDEDNISFLSTTRREGAIDLTFSFSHAEYMTAGNHTASYEIDICYDYSCVRSVEGSPFSFQINYEVNRFPSNTTLIDPTNRTQLNHDVIDAEYSSLLNSIAIVSAYPRNSLYIYDLDDISNVNEIGLNLAPTSVSFANAGNSKKIVVGHDARITYIDFDPLVPTNSVFKVLNVPVDVFDLVATDQAAYAVPRVDQWTELQRVNISDNSLSISEGWSIRAGSKIKLHPDFKSVYLADRGLSPSDIEKIGIQNDTPDYLYDSPYHGDYAMCGDLWMSIDGKRIYTACGNTFRSADSQSQDMIYSGRIPLFSNSTSYYNSYRMASVSESSTKNEIAVIEYQSDYSCTSLSSSNACIYALSFFNKDILNRMSGTAFDTVTISGNSYFEKPEYAFYNSQGDSVFVITQLQDIPTQRSFILEFAR